MHELVALARAAETSNAIDDDALDAAFLWQAVLSGQWALLAQLESSVDRSLIVRRNRAGERPAAPLSDRERRIASCASRGKSNKLIAYELGMCSSSVATQLTSATKKLGLSSRETLLHVFAVLDRPAGNRGRDAAERIHVTRLEFDGADAAIIRIVIAPALPTSLTAAEREVASLVIAGMSNAAIAAQRQTSVRTVANQLRSIFAKLAVGSRRQLSSRYSATAPG